MDVRVEQDGSPGKRSASMRLIAASVALLLLVGTIAAFSRSGSDSEATEGLVQLTAAPAAARAAGTASISIASDTEAAGQTVSFSMDGVADLASGASVFTATFDVLGQAFGFELRTDGEQAWISVPEASRAASGGKPWFVIAATTLAGGQQELDLDAQLGYLDALVASKETEVIGESQKPAARVRRDSLIGPMSSTRTHPTHATIAPLPQGRLDPSTRPSRCCSRGEAGGVLTGRTGRIAGGLSDPTKVG